MTEKIEIEFVIDNPEEMRPVQLGSAFALEDGPVLSEEQAAELFDHLQESK